MKVSHLYHLLIALLVGTAMTSCSTSKEKKSESSDLAKSLLWKIDGNGLQQHSYLYGTIHMIPADDYFLPEGTLSAIDESKKMVFEIDMNEMSDMGSIMGLMTQAFMKDGKSLSDLLDDEDYALVEAHFKKLGMPLMMLERIKPAFLSVFAMDMDPNGMQNGSIKSYEMEFFKMANETSKPVAGLETLEFQMSIFDSIPYPDQAKMLVDAIKSGDSGNDQFKDMVRMYKTQDVQAMVDMIEADENLSAGDNNDLLLVKRNKNWIPIMADMMAKETTFFAVGAGHLAGNQGVIQLLRNKGYTLTPMNKG